MSALKNIVAITGLHPFNLNRISFVFGFSIATLVIAKLVDAYLFCGFNESVLNFFVDVPLGVVLFPGFCIMPLLGLAVNRKPITKGGRCCRMFAIILICIWQFLTYSTIFAVQYLVLAIGRNDKAAYDPFNLCGNRTVDNVRTQFNNAMPAFDIFQRIDLTFKIAVALGWLVLLPLALATFVLFLYYITETLRNHQELEDPEHGKSEEANDETIVWMEESSEGKTEQPSAIADHGSIDIEDESAPDDAAREAEDRKSEFGSVDVRMENLRNEINEPGSDAESQSKEAKDLKFSFVDEEGEKATTTKAEEDSK